MRPHNPATGFQPTSATVVSAEPFSHAYEKKKKRPSDPWYDDNYCILKRRVRQLERTACCSGRPADQAVWSTQCRAYHVLLQQKRENFWMQKIDAERTCPHKLWRSVDALMVRGHVSVSDLISVTEYHAFINRKVADMHATTADATPATYTSAPPHCALSEIRPLDISDVTKAVKLLPDKQCSADPMPTWLLRECAHVLAPFLCHMFNASLQQG